MEEFSWCVLFISNHCPLGNASKGAGHGVFTWTGTLLCLFAKGIGFFLPWLDPPPWLCQGKVGEFVQKFTYLCHAWASNAWHLFRWSRLVSLSVYIYVGIFMSKHIQQLREAGVPHWCFSGLQMRPQMSSFAVIPVGESAEGTCPRAEGLFSHLTHMCCALSQPCWWMLVELS